MYKDFIWDFDGTLFDAYPPMTKAVMQTLEEFDIIEESQKVFELMKISMTHLMEYLIEEYQVTDTFFRSFERNREKIEEEEMEPFDGVKELCQFIIQRGGTNHLYTHRDKSAIQYLEKYEMLHLFKVKIIEESGFPRKPSPDALLSIIKEEELDKKTTIMIGDRDIDILAAHNAGIHGCYFKNRNRKNLAISDLTIESFSELENYIYK